MKKWEEEGAVLDWFFLQDETVLSIINGVSIEFSHPALQADELEQELLLWCAVRPDRMQGYMENPGWFNTAMRQQATQLREVADRQYNADESYDQWKEEVWDQ